MRSLERVRYVTRYYEKLWGLKLVPVGLFMILLASGESGLGPSWLRSGQVSIPGLMVFVLMIGLMWAAGVYYRRSFGRVVRGASERNMAFDAVIGVAVFGAVISVNWLDAVLRPTVSLTGITIAALLVLWWFATSKARRHYLILAALLLVLTLLPLLGAPFDARFPFDDMVGAALVSGVGLIVIGVGDHLLLARTFKAVPEEGEDAVR